MDSTTATPIERLDTSALSRRWNRHPVSIGRYVEQKLLAPPHHFLGRKMWFLHEVLEAEAKLAAIAPARRKVGGVALAAQGRAAKDLNRRIALAAADLLARAGASVLARVVEPFTSGHLDDIPSDRKPEAYAALCQALKEATS